MFPLQLRNRQESKTERQKDRRTKSGITLEFSNARALRTHNTGTSVIWPTVWTSPFFTFFLFLIFFLCLFSPFFILYEFRFMFVWLFQWDSMSLNSPYYLKIAHIWSSPIRNSGVPRKCLTLREKKNQQMRKQSDSFSFSFSSSSPSSSSSLYPSSRSSSFSSKWCLWFDFHFHFHFLCGCLFPLLHYWPTPALICPAGIQIRSVT